MKVQRATLTLSLVILFVASLSIVVVASAKGNFSSLLVIDLETGEVRQVEDPQLQGFFALTDFESGSKEAPTHGPGYEIWRLGEGQAGGLFAFDHLRYYPPGSQEHGYVFYEGIVNGGSEYDQRWYPSTPQGDTLFQTALEASVQGNPQLTLWQVAALAFFALVTGAFAGFALRSRRPGQECATRKDRAATVCGGLCHAQGLWLRA